MLQPSLIGARLESGLVCVGLPKSPKHARYQFYDPVTHDTFLGSIWEACKKGWNNDPNTISILENALREVLYLKGMPKMDRGSAATQHLETNKSTFLYLYEAGYRGALYPRYFWRMSYCKGYPGVLAEALSMELSSKTVVAEKDVRQAVFLERDPNA